MNKQNYLLTFEWDQEKKRLEVHANKEGLEKIREEITILLNAKGNDHSHLMTPSWGGKELSNQVQSDENLLINHVKIFKWDETETKS